MKRLTIGINCILAAMILWALAAQAAVTKKIHVDWAYNPHQGRRLLDLRWR